jgi:hypothetical protein
MATRWQKLLAPERLGVGWRFHCWRYENGRWRNSASPKFGGDAASRFLLFRDERGRIPVSRDLKRSARENLAGPMAGR